MGPRSTHAARGIAGSRPAPDGEVPAPSASPPGRAWQAPRTARVLRAGSWLAVGVSDVALQVALAVHAGDGALTTVLTYGQAVIFLVLLARTGLAVASARRRVPRLALLGLLTGLLTWMAGSLTISGADPQDAVAFPHPGEFLFLAGYLGFTCFLVLGSRRHGRGDADERLSNVGLEAVIVCGGTACMALLLMATPAAKPADGSELPQLVALLYPLLDLVLLMILVAQLTMHRRTLDRRSLTLALALVVLMAADLSLVLTLGQTQQLAQNDLLPDQLWAIGFLLLVDAATAPRRWHAQGGDVPGGRRPSAGIPVVLAGVAAVAALSVDVPGTPQLLSHTVAMVTLAAAGLRMLLAVRQAHRLNDELRRSRIDDLTGLANRRGAEDRLTALLRQHAAPARPDGVPDGDAVADADGVPEGSADGVTADGSDDVAEGARVPAVGLVLVDLDGFRDVNDGLGHDAGDLVLRVLADRIADDPLADVLAARVGGDEFALITRDHDGLSLLEEARRLLEVIRRPVRADGMEVTLAATAGIALAAPGVSARELLRRAEVAMYAAKEGTTGAQLYDAEGDGFTRERLREGADLSRALQAGEIVAWYQPQIDAATGRPCGLEALVRWVHPEQGVVPPLNFLPAARRTGRMPALTKAVMAGAIADTAAWHAAGVPVRVAVNVAPAELLAPGMLDVLFSLARAAGLAPGSLVVEVTEESFAHGERTREAIELIRAAGHEVSIDDYGTGFSSLSYLRDLPVQELKIDRSFVMHVAQERTAMIVKATIELAHGLGMRVVAEGVSDEGIARRLRDMGADELQGFLYARPMPAAEIARWWEQQLRASVTWHDAPVVVEPEVVEPEVVEPEVVEPEVVEPEVVRDTAPAPVDGPAPTGGHATGAQTTGAQTTGVQTTGVQTTGVLAPARPQIPATRRPPA